MKKISYVISMIAIFALASCSTNKNLATYTISSEKADCYGVMPMKCMLVKEGDAQNWTLFYSNIDGFDYEEGYEYVLKVKKLNVENPPADRSSIKYTLIKVVSKTKK